MAQMTLNREDYASSDEYWADKDKVANDIREQMKVQQNRTPSFVDDRPDWQRFC